MNSMREGEQEDAEFQRVSWAGITDVGVFLAPACPAQVHHVLAFSLAQTWLDTSQEVTCTLVISLFIWRRMLPWGSALMRCVLTCHIAAQISSSSLTGSSCYRDGIQVEYFPSGILCSFLKLFHSSLVMCDYMIIVRASSCGESRHQLVTLPLTFTYGSTLMVWKNVKNVLYSFRASSGFT